MEEQSEEQVEETAESAAEERRKTVEVKKLHVNAKGGIERIELTSGEDLVGVIGGGMQQNAARIDQTGEMVDIMDLKLMGKFEIEMPKVQVVENRILGPNGQPIG